MKELLKLGVYTLLGTLLLSAPFAGLGMLSTHLVTEKTFWIQLITLFLSAVSLQGLWLNPSKELCPWTYVDILPLSLLGLILLSYPYSIHPEPEKLLIRVSDTGCGIPEEFQRSIFHPFFRVDKSRSREYGGAGLGLSLVWEIANLHGGLVWVAESSETGTTIAVELPIQQAAKP